MLSTQQREALRRDGYVLLQGAVAPELIDTAVHAINARIGGGIPEDKLTQFAAQTWFPEVAVSPPITDLYNASTVAPTVAALLGGEPRGTGYGQIALRFPRPLGTESKPPISHLDGIHSPTNGVPQGELHSFTLLAAVFLTPVRGPYAGNFSVWPGSHRLMEAYFQEHGFQDLLQGGFAPRLDYGDAVQIEAEPGDVVLAHYQLLHGITMNLAPNPRFAVFFRVKHPQHDQNRLDCLTNLWREWPGVANS